MRCYLNLIPKDVVFMILKELSPEDLGNVKQIDRLSSIYNDPSFQREYFKYWYNKDKKLSIRYLVSFTNCYNNYIDWEGDHFEKIILNLPDDANGQKEMIQFAIDNGHFERIILNLASAIGQKEIVNFMLNQGINVNTRYGDDRSPLMWASACGHQDIVEILVCAGAAGTINDDDRNHRTALMMAAERGHTNIVKILLNAGAAETINDRDIYDETALMMASSEGHLEIVCLLLDFGVNIEARGPLHMNAIDMASRGGHIEIVKMLLNEHKNNIYNKNPYVQEAMISGRHTDLAKSYLIGIIRPALREAIHSQHIDIVKLFLNAGFDVNYQYRDGETVLMLLIEYNEEYFPELTQILLDAGADVNIKDKHGKTALTMASEKGCVEIVDLLKKYGTK